MFRTNCGKCHYNEYHLFNFAPQIFPRQKDAEFDAEGRPYSPFFYTATPQTTTLLHDIAAHIEQV